MDRICYSGKQTPFGTVSLSLEASRKSCKDFPFVCNNGGKTKIFSHSNNRSWPKTFILTTGHDIYSFHSIKQQSSKCKFINHEVYFLLTCSCNQIGHNESLTVTSNKPKHKQYMSYILYDSSDIVTTDDVKVRTSKGQEKIIYIVIFTFAMLTFYKLQ